MNVIWIVSDTYRRDAMGAYGNPVIRTPSLDSLAASGTPWGGETSGDPLVVGGNIRSVTVRECRLRRRDWSDGILPPHGLSR